MDFFVSFPVKFNCKDYHTAPIGDLNFTSKDITSSRLAYSHTVNNLAISHSVAVAQATSYHPLRSFLS